MTSGIWQAALVSRIAIVVSPFCTTSSTRVRRYPAFTAVRVIPAIGHKAGDVLDFGGLLGHAPIMPISKFSPAVMIHRGGRIPAPMQALKN